MRRALRFTRFPVFLTVVLALVLVALRGRAELVVHIYVLVLAAFGLGHLLAGLRRALPPRVPSAFDAAMTRRTQTARRIPELERMEREVSLGLSTAFDLHFRLRPRLRGIASELLAARRGIDLDGNPEAARRALGEAAWDIVRSDRESPRERHAPGLGLDSLRLAVSALEAL
jgi:hypothetical protein